MGPQTQTQTAHCTLQTAECLRSDRCRAVAARVGSVYRVLLFLLAAHNYAIICIRNSHTLKCANWLAACSLWEPTGRQVESGEWKVGPFRLAILGRLVAASRQLVGGQSAATVLECPREWRRLIAARRAGHLFAGSKGASCAQEPNKWPFLGGRAGLWAAA